MAGLHIFLNMKFIAGCGKAKPLYKFCTAVLLISYRKITIKQALSSPGLPPRSIKWRSVLLDHYHRLIF